MLPVCYLGKRSIIPFMVLFTAVWRRNLILSVGFFSLSAPVSSSFRLLKRVTYGTLLVALSF